MDRRVPGGNLPANVYRESDRIMVVVPVPGMEPPSIRVEIQGRSVGIHASQRGPGQDRTQQYIRHEWSIGPYDRTLDLPTWVDVKKANASYDNGVLVLILPTAPAPTNGEIVLPKVGTVKGRLVGHVGQDLRPPDRRE